MPEEIDELWAEEAFARHRACERLQAELEERLSTTEVLVRSPDELVEVLVRADGSISRVTVAGPLRGRTDVELSQALEVVIGAAADAASWARRTLYAEALHVLHRPVGHR